ncbi:unnamed protein product, partial [Iphiclides podalirius]
MGGLQQPLVAPARQRPSTSDVATDGAQCATVSNVAGATNRNRAPHRLPTGPQCGPHSVQANATLLVDIQWLFANKEYEPALVTRGRGACSVTSLSELGELCTCLKSYSCM